MKKLKPSGIRMFVAAVMTLVMIISAVTLIPSRSYAADKKTAADIQTGDLIRIGKDNAAGYTGTPLWRVLHKETTDGSMLLLSEYLWTGNGSNAGALLKFNDVNPMSGTGYENEWYQINGQIGESNARKWCREKFRPSILDGISGLSIKQITGDDMSVTINGNAYSGARLRSDEVFFLSAAEANTYLNNAEERKAYLSPSDTEAKRWWLRSPQGYSNNAGIVNVDGSISKLTVNTQIYARPAMWAVFDDKTTFVSSDESGKTTWTMESDSTEPEAVDKTALGTAISAANAAMEGVSVSADGKDVDLTNQYTTQAEKTALTDAVAAAQSVYDKTDASQLEVGNAVSALNTAIEEYNTAKKYGIRISVIISREGDDEFQPARGGSYSWIAIDQNSGNIRGKVAAGDFTLRMKKASDGVNKWADAQSGSVELTELDDGSVRVTAAIPDNEDAYDKDWSIVYNGSDPSTQAPSCESIKYTQEAGDAQVATPYISVAEKTNPDKTFDVRELPWNYSQYQKDSIPPIYIVSVDSDAVFMTIKEHGFKSENDHSFVSPWTYGGATFEKASVTFERSCTSGSNAEPMCDLGAGDIDDNDDVGLASLVSYWEYANVSDSVPSAEDLFNKLKPYALDPEHPENTGADILWVKNGNTAERFDQGVRDYILVFIYADELEFAKSDAVKALNSIDVSRYEDPEKTAVEKAISDAKDTVRKASSTDEVSSAVKAAENKIAEQKTIEQKAKEASDRKDAEEKTDTEKKTAEDKKSDDGKSSADTSAAEEKSKGIVEVTVTSREVNAKSIDAAIKAAGGNEAYVTTLVLSGKVKIISKGALKKHKNIKTLVIRSRKLSKKSVRGSLKGSGVKTIKVKIGSKKINGKYVKKYKKIFSRKNAGKKVKVK